MSTFAPDVCEAFYRERDRRTAEMLGAPLTDARPIVVSIDAASTESAAGQLLLFALLNQLVRVHRRIHVTVPHLSAALLVRVPFAAPTIGETALLTVESIDPCGQFSVSSETPTSFDLRNAIRVGIGEHALAGADWYLGADRAFASLSLTPVGVASTNSSMRGAALASCLGAAAVVRTQLGRGMQPVRVSAWNFAEGERGTPGPDELLPVSIGRVLMVGAGAVGAALAYWLLAMGVDSRDWIVPDADIVKLHNTNRGLLFTPEHAGWPTGIARRKADIIATTLGNAVPVTRWYDEWPARKSNQFDVVLALANERSVRAQLSELNAVVTLQATTSSAWQSQLHRHVLGHDDCVQCRTGALSALPLECSVGTTDSHNDAPRNDAALPFLSAASGLMLATALQRLMHGELLSSTHNRWAWDFASEREFSIRPGTSRCNFGCGYVLDPKTRQLINSGTRWSALDCEPASRDT